MSKKDMPGLDNRVLLMCQSECSFPIYLAKKSKIGLKLVTPSSFVSSAVLHAVSLTISLSGSVVSLLGSACLCKKYVIYFTNK